MTMDTAKVRAQWNKDRTKPQDIERFSYQYVGKMLDRIEELERLLAERNCRECPE